MDEKKGTISHFAGIIRIVAAVIITILLLILFVRWANSRREANNNTESKVDQTSQSEKTKSDVEVKKDDSSEVSADNSPQESSIPSGIDDRRVADTGPQTVPATGISTSIAYVVMLMLVTYLTAYNLQLKRTYSDKRN